MKTNEKNNKKENKQNIAKKQTIIKIVVFLMICTLVGVAFIFQTKIESWINFRSNADFSSNMSDNGLKVHFIDVGQADSIALEFPTGEHMLVDAGDNSNDSREKMIHYLNVNVFTANEEKTFDYFILTHYHADHIGGAEKIFEDYKVEKCYFPSIDDLDTLSGGSGQYEKSQLTSRVLAAQASEEGSTLEKISADLVLSIGDVTLTFFSPFYNATTIENANNQSPIIVISYRGKSLMLTGDSEKELEKEVIADATDNGKLSLLDIDVLKIAHHGAKNSTCQEFLDVTTPEFCIISVGEGNSYGHPNEDTIQRLTQNGIEENKLFRTDENKNVILLLSESGNISISPEESIWSPVWISLWYVAGIIVLASAVVIFLPKKKRKKVLNAVSRKKK